MLATVLAVQGSSFRRPGARLWIGARDRAGSVSAGCLEDDLAERAARLRTSGRSTLVSYDTATEDDVLWGTASGCGGRLDILLEPLTEEIVGHLAWMADESRRRRRCVLVTQWNGERAERHRVPESIAATEAIADGLAGVAEETLRSGRNKVLTDESRITLIEAAIPNVALTIVGGGDDAAALARHAALQGWDVCVVDRGRRLEQITGAVVTAEELEAIDLPFDERSAVVLMTHNFHRDAEILAHLKGRTLGYLGVLGPKRRTTELLCQIGLASASLAALHAPPGLDLGGETPDEIALSIVAEIQAVFAGRRGGMLRELNGPIHDRVDASSDRANALLPK